jgi:hypothetical protein
MTTSLGMVVGAISLLAVDAAVAQTGNMMNGDGGMWSGGWMGGYGGSWWPILLVIVAVGLVAWFVKQKNK